MVAPYTVRFHPFSVVPAIGDRGYLIRVVPTQEYLFSRSPAGGKDGRILYGQAPKILGLDVRAEGACAVQSINPDGSALILPLSDAETRALLSATGEIT